MLSVIFKKFQKLIKNANLNRFKCKYLSRIKLIENPQKDKFYYNDVACPKNNLKPLEKVYEVVLMIHKKDDVKVTQPRKWKIMKKQQQNVNFFKEKKNQFCFSFNVFFSVVFVEYIIMKFIKEMCIIFFLQRKKCGSCLMFIIVAYVFTLFKKFMYFQCSILKHIFVAIFEWFFPIFERIYLNNCLGCADELKLLTGLFALKSSVTFVKWHS